MTGEYDSTKPLPPMDCDAVLFTEKPMETPGWNNIVERRPENHPRLRAKWYKMHPHVLFPDAECSVWIDSSVLVTNHGFPQEICKYLKEAPLAFFPHRWRDNLKDELKASMEHAKYWGLPGDKQIESYYAAGYRDERKLVECTVLPRRHNDPEAIAFNEAWWEENVKWTYMDQLSAPYLLWKLQTFYTLLPFTLATQPWFRITTWRSDR